MVNLTCLSGSINPANSVTGASVIFRHALRKTWVYQRVGLGTGLPELMVCFNHSTQRQTLEYLCVQARGDQKRLCQ